MDNESSLVCTLGGGGDGDMDDTNNKEDDDGGGEGDIAGKYDKYGPAGVDRFVPLKKKNRQGQRGRRAKAFVIEAKKRYFSAESNIRVRIRENRKFEHIMTMKRIRKVDEGVVMVEKLVRKSVLVDVAKTEQQ